MTEIRILGRGGQGAYISAEILANAFVKEGQYATSFPMFGGERRGAPIQVFVRFDKKPIRLRTKVYYPDCLVVTDPLLARSPNAFTGLKPGGIVIMNLPGMPENTPHKNTGVLASVEATGIALEEIGRPITNTVMLGALVYTTGWVTIDSIVESFEGYFSGKVLEGNIRCVRRGFQETEVIRFGGN